MKRNSSLDQVGSPSSLFMFTEVGIMGSKSTRSTNKLSTLPALPKTPQGVLRKFKPAQTFKETPSTRPQTTWNEFLKSKKYAGNLSTTQFSERSSAVGERLSKITAEVTEGIISARLPSRTNIQLDKNFENEFQSLSLNVLDKKKEYNRLKFEREHKEKLLERVERELEQQIKGSEVSQELRDKLQAKKFEYKEISRVLDDEVNYSFVLKYMQADRKKSLIEIGKPIHEFKIKNGKFNQKINSASLELDRVRRDAVEIQQDIESIEKRRVKNKEDYDRNVKILEAKHIEKESVLNLLKQTSFKSEVLQQISHKERIADQLEAISQKVEQEEKLEKELKELETFCDMEEMNFQEIQRSTSVSSVEELFNYHKYLLETTQNLQSTITLTISHIESLTRTRNNLKSSLHYQMLKTTPQPEYTQRVVENREEELLDRQRELEKKESDLKKLENLISHICGSLSRIGAQLLETPSVDIKPINLDNYLSLLSLKLDQILTLFYNREIPNLRESINNSLQFTSPPNFLHINPLQILPAKYKQSVQEPEPAYRRDQGESLYRVVEKFDRLISKQ